MNIFERFVLKSWHKYLSKHWFPGLSSDTDESMKKDLDELNKKHSEYLFNKIMISVIILVVVYTAMKILKHYCGS